MKPTKFIIAAVLVATTGLAQLKSPPSGGNKKASVSEMVGITDVTIHYDRPGVRGREGKIYGTNVVHKGFIDLGLGNNVKSPWRAGANENTTIEFSTEVKIEGKDLPAGKYGFFVVFDEKECTLIFSKNSVSWGSYYYDPAEDALRVTVKPVLLDKSVEWLKYEFIDQSENSAVIALQWEKLMIPFKVEVDLVKTSLADFRNELRGEKGFTWEALEQAASFCATHTVSLEEGLAWANFAVSYGNNFRTLKTKAELHRLLGDQVRSDSVMKVALPKGTMTDLHYYGRKLLDEKKTKEAMDVFLLNAKKNPGVFTTYVGLARGFSAKGDFKNALVNARQALPLAPNELNKKSVEGMVTKLEKKEDIN